MVDFKRIKEEQSIRKNLDVLKVPEYENLWDRVVAFAAGFEDIYAAKLCTLKVEQEKEYNIFPFELSEDQSKAWAKILVWLTNTDQYMLLTGFSGTGKSTLLRMLAYHNKNAYFTAPTNKATKVLSKIIGRDAKTTFSQLGLRMSEDDDKLVMDYNGKAYMAEGSILVVDEVSMVGRQLFDFIDEFSRDNNVRVLYCGDPLQLPPVGEKRSKAWSCVKNNATYAKMTKVMRHDNQILTLATRIREYITSKKYKYPIKDDNDGTQGVFHLKSQSEFIKQIKQFNTPQDFIENKVIAWRNKTVNQYNNIIREHLGLTGTYSVGDIIMMAEPVEKDGTILVHVDDEFTVNAVNETSIKIYKGPGESVDIPVYRLNVSSEDQAVVLDIPIDDSELNEILTNLAAHAKTETGPQKREAWRQFWTVKRAFHKTRFAFAITAHRSQGSTLKKVFCDTADILKNPNEREGMKALYVAVTRASKSVYTY